MIAADLGRFKLAAITCTRKQIQLRQTGIKMLSKTDPHQGTSQLERNRGAINRRDPNPSKVLGGNKEGLMGREGISDMGKVDCRS